MPPIVEATSDIWLMIFHRGTQRCGRRGARVAERFNCLYTEDELHEWALRVRKVASENASFMSSSRDVISICPSKIEAETSLQQADQLEPCNTDQD